MEDNVSFSATFVPVDTSISIRDFKRQNQFTVWNDRPQAGSVQDDKSIKLLIQRNVRTNDQGGISEKMYGSNYAKVGQLELQFKLQMYESKLRGPWLAKR